MEQPNEDNEPDTDECRSPVLSSRLGRARVHRPTQTRSRSRSGHVRARSRSSSRGCDIVAPSRQYSRDHDTATLHGGSRGHDTVLLRYHHDAALSRNASRERNPSPQCGGPRNRDATPTRGVSQGHDTALLRRSPRLHSATLPLADPRSINASPPRGGSRRSSHVRDTVAPRRVSSRVRFTRERSRSRQPRRSRDRDSSRSRAPPRVRYRSRSRSRSCSRRPAKRLPNQDDSADTKGERSGTSTSKSSIDQLVEALKVIAQSNSNQSNSSDKIDFHHNNPIPEFDPSKREQTMTMWLHKVNECAGIYKWSERQIIHFAIPKLRGVAQRWYQGLPTVLFSWPEWQEKLSAAFPSTENYGQMLSDMLAKRAHFGESLEDYFYDKVALINRCDIKGKRAVECILHGIDDRSVRLGAEAVQYDDPDKLLPYLRNVRNVKPTTERRNNNRNFTKSNELDKIPEKLSNRLSRPIRCFNCKLNGHVSSQCQQPVNKCQKCLRIGHNAEQCFTKTPPSNPTKILQTNEKSVLHVKDS